jgi:hypothetical protein
LVFFPDLPAVPDYDHSGTEEQNTFFGKQEKATTFLMAIKNFMIIMGTNAVVILISALIA